MSGGERQDEGKNLFGAAAAGQMLRVGPRDQKPGQQRIVAAVARQQCAEGGVKDTLDLKSLAPRMSFELAPEVGLDRKPMLSARYACKSAAVEAGGEGRSHIVEADRVAPICERFLRLIRLQPLGFLRSGRNFRRAHIPGGFATKNSRQGIGKKGFFPLVADDRMQHDRQKRLSTGKQDDLDARARAFQEIEAPVAEGFSRGQGFSLGRSGAFFADDFDRHGVRCAAILLDAAAREPAESDGQRRILGHERAAGTGNRLDVDPGAQSQPDDLVGKDRVIADLFQRPDAFLRDGQRKAFEDCVHRRIGRAGIGEIGDLLVHLAIQTFSETRIG